MRIQQAETMVDSGSDHVLIRVFRGSDSDQYESYVQFYDISGLLISTRQHCVQKPQSGNEKFSEDRHFLDLNSFFFYEWENVGRIECHCDLQEICLSENLRPKVGTIEFLDERRRDLIKRGRFSLIDEEDAVTQCDISKFFTKMSWQKPVIPMRRCDLSLYDLSRFPILIESHFRDRSFSASVRFFDLIGNLIDLSNYKKVFEFENEHVYEEWTTVDLPAFLKKEWAKVSVVEARSDLTALDRFRHVKGNIDYLIYCKANNYKKLPEYLYKRIQTRKLEDFLKDIRTGS